MTQTNKQVTKEEMQAYEDCRQGGRTNMSDVHNVITITGLERDTIMAIMKDYSNLITKFGISRGD